MASSKGQSANELLVIYMFVMLVFTLFVATFAQQRSIEMQESRVGLADSIGEQFASELNLAVRSGDGYSRKVIYPLKLDGVTPYSITLNNISKSIDIGFSSGTLNYSHSFPVVSTNARVYPEIVAKLPSGAAYGYVLYSSNFSFAKGNIYIQNINGILFISTVMYFKSSPYSIVLDASPSQIGTWMNTSNITAVVLDQFGNPVRDGMLVRFQTSLGMIDDFVPTVNGTAKATLVSGTSSGIATVIANVSGIKATKYVKFVS